MLKKLNLILSPQLLPTLRKYLVVTLSKMEISMLFRCKLSATLTSLTDLQNSSAANV